MSISLQIIQEILFFYQLALTNSIKVIQAQVFCFVLIYYLHIRPHTKFHVNRSSSFWNIKNKRFLTNSVYQLGGLTKKHFLMLSNDTLWGNKLTFQISWKFVCNFLFYWIFKYFLVGKPGMFWPTYMIWLKTVETCIEYALWSNEASVQIWSMSDKKFLSC